MLNSAGELKQLRPLYGTLRLAMAMMQSSTGVAWDAWEIILRIRDSSKDIPLHR